MRDLIFNRQKLDDMVEYHMWGIDPGLPNRPTNLEKLTAIYKLVYHQAPYHRVKSFTELIDNTIDAGPRLLACSISRPSVPLPVSRFYPQLPDDVLTGLQPDYVRPLDAAPGQYDIWLQQHLYSSREPPPSRGLGVSHKKGPTVRTRRGPSRRAKTRAANRQASQLGSVPHPGTIQNPAESLSLGEAVEALAQPGGNLAQTDEALAHLLRLATQTPQPDVPYPAGDTASTQPAEYVSNPANNLTLNQPIEAVSPPDETMDQADETISQIIEMATEPVENHPRPFTNVFHPINRVPQPVPQSAENVTHPANTAPQIIMPPSYVAKHIIDEVEKAVLRFAYVGLERHSTAAPRHPRPHITATGDDDLFKALVGPSSAVSYVKLSYNPTTETWNFDDSGNAHPCRGRGPVWRNNSSAVDCAIVVGRLLDAGSTQIDRGRSGWQNTLSNAERAFIEATDLNWDVCTPDDSADMRDSFWNALTDTNPEIGVGKSNPFWTIWSICTANFAQFQYRYAEKVINCQCSGLGSTTELFYSSFVHATLGKDDKPSVTMQELVSRYFSPEWVDDCTLCHKTRAVPRRRTFSSLPMRMVVLCDDRRVKNHTQPLEITYTDGQRNTKTEKYRWLGGVYYKHGHFRVVWTDTNRGENDTGNLRFYDGRQNHGLIVGGVAPAHQHEKVPGSWMGAGIFPLLVYEKIKNPDPEVLHVAMQSIQDMVTAQNQEMLILEHHTPWTQTPLPKDLPAQPWTRILPDHGQHFYTVAGGQFPGLPGRRSPSDRGFFRRAEPSAQLTHAYLEPPPYISVPNPLNPSEAVTWSEAVARPGHPQFFVRTSPQTLPLPIPTAYPLQPAPVSQGSASGEGSQRSSAMQVDTETQTFSPGNLNLAPIDPPSSPSWTANSCQRESHNDIRPIRKTAGRKVAKRILSKKAKVSKPSRSTRSSARLSRLSQVVVPLTP